MKIVIYRPGQSPIETTTPVQLRRGDVLGVQFVLSYTSYDDSSVTLRGFLYSEGEEVVADSGLVAFDLPSAVGGTISGQVPITIGEGVWGYPGFQITLPVPTPSAGLYTLGIFCVGAQDVYDVEVDAVQIVKDPGLLDTISSMIPMIVMVMMMGMIMPMMSGIGESTAGSPEGGVA